MPVYVDDFRVPATVAGTRGRWSHLTADTPHELHEFANKIGLRRAWFQAKCKSGPCPSIDGVCAHFHYDVVDSRRTAAIAAGAREIGIREMGAITSLRRVAYREGAQR
jgi:hypothetical protein